MRPLVIIFPPSFIPSIVTYGKLALLGLSNLQLIFVSIYKYVSRASIFYTKLTANPSTLIKHLISMYSRFHWWWLTQSDPYLLRMVIFNQFRRNSNLISHWLRLSQSPMVPSGRIQYTFGKHPLFQKSKTQILKEKNVGRSYRIGKGKQKRDIWTLWFSYTNLRNIADKCTISWQFVPPLVTGLIGIPLFMLAYVHHMLMKWLFLDSWINTCVSLLPKAISLYRSTIFFFLRKIQLYYELLF